MSLSLPEDAADTVGPAHSTNLLSVFFITCPGRELCAPSRGAVVFNAWVPLLKLLKSSV